MFSRSRHLNETQEHLLRSLCLRSGGEAPRTELDGRIVRALERRKLVAPVRDQVVVTGAGRIYHDTYLKNLAPPPSGVAGARDAWEACLSALGTLGEHLPKDAEIDLSQRGDGSGILAYADDVVRALRRYVEQAR